MTNEMNKLNSNANGSEFLIRYTPDKRNGVHNLGMEEFTYHISVSGSVFHNSEVRNPVGFYGFDLERGEIRRFRWDNLNEVISLAE